MVRIQRVQTVIFFLPPGVSRVMVWRLGLIFLGDLPAIYIRLWATLFPNTVVFPQISQRNESASSPGFRHNGEAGPGVSITQKKRRRKPEDGTEAKESGWPGFWAVLP